jgi:hypothetical protein
VTASTDCFVPAPVNSLGPDRQAAIAAAVIGDGDFGLEYVDDRPQQTLGLSTQLVEFRAEPVPAMPRWPLHSSSDNG